MMCTRGVWVIWSWSHNGIFFSWYFREICKEFCLWTFLSQYNVYSDLIILNTSVPLQQIHVSRGLFKRRAKVHPSGRMIQHVRMDDDGFILDNWPDFNFDDYSVSNLRAEVALRQDDENITLCLRAGKHALLIPLITDLPHNTDPLDIIVVTTGSPGELELCSFRSSVDHLSFHLVRCIKCPASSGKGSVDCKQHSPCKALNLIFFEGSAELV